jgi:hypothetical protein
MWVSWSANPSPASRSSSNRPTRDITDFSSAEFLRDRCFGFLMIPMGQANPDSKNRNVMLATLVACVLLFGIMVLAARQVKLEAPASHHARSLLKLDNALGATLEPLDARAARLLGGGSQVDEMVVTSVAAGGRASAAGLRVGDVVEDVDGAEASDLDQAIDAVSTDPTQIVVNRHGSRVMLMVPAPAATSRG